MQGPSLKNVQDITRIKDSATQKHIVRTSELEANLTKEPGI